MATLKIRNWVGSYTEVPFPKTVKEYNALLEGPILDAPSVGEDVWKPLYRVFGKQEGFVVEREDEFLRWMALQTQKMNIALQERPRKEAQERRKRWEAKKEQHKKQMKQLYEEKVAREAQKRIEEQRFEAAVQAKIQQLTPAGSR